MAHPGGRPSKRTPQLTTTICEGLAMGLNNSEVAARAKISTDTLNRWLQIEEFADAVAAAMAERKFKRLQAIESGKNGWQSICWILERAEPMRYGRPEVTLQMNSQININTVSPLAEMLNPSWGKKPLALPE
jgi:hypothetical protein